MSDFAGGSAILRRLSCGLTHVHFSVLNCTTLKCRQHRGIFLMKCNASLFQEKNNNTVPFDLGKKWFLRPDARAFKQEWEWKLFLDGDPKQPCTHRHLKYNVSAAYQPAVYNEKLTPVSGRPEPWASVPSRTDCGASFQVIKRWYVFLFLLPTLTESNGYFSKVGRSGAHHPSQGARVPCGITGPRVIQRLQTPSSLPGWLPPTPTPK